MSEKDDYLGLISVIGTFVMANLFWIVLSVPLITMPLATAGLFEVMSKWVRGKHPELFRDFFGAMREYWARAYVIALLDVLVGGVVVLNLHIISLIGETDAIAVMARSAAVLVGIVLLLVNQYAWSLLVVAEQPVRETLRFSLRLVAAHPLQSAGVLLAAAAPVLIGLFIPLLFLLLGLVSLSAWILNWGIWRIIRRYIPDEELQKLEAR